MGVPKYKDLNIPYPLEGVPSMDAAKIPELRDIVMKARAERLMARKMALRAAQAAQAQAQARMQTQQTACVATGVAQQRYLNALLIDLVIQPLKKRLPLL